MVYVIAQSEGTSKLFMCLPDHKQAVQVCPVARYAGALTKAFRDWSGNMVTPHDGERFLEAAFDYFTLQGLKLHWVDVGRCGLAQLDILGIET